MDHLAIDEGRGRRIADLQFDAPGVAHDLHVEVAVALEDLLGVVVVAAGVEHCERAIAKQRVKPGLTGIEQLVDFGLREILEAAARADARIDRIGHDDIGLQGHCGVRTRDGPQGRMSIGVLSCVIIHNSTISESDMAMQPSVQSALA